MMLSQQYTVAVCILLFKVLTVWHTFFQWIPLHLLGKVVMNSKRHCTDIAMLSVVTLHCSCLNTIICFVFDAQLRKQRCILMQDKGSHR